MWLNTEEDESAYRWRSRRWSRWPTTFSFPLSAFFMTLAELDHGPPEFFWLVMGLPSVGMECWKICTVSWTVCRCRQTSNGSMQVETFWANRYLGSDRRRFAKAVTFSWLRPIQKEKKVQRLQEYSSKKKERQSKIDGYMFPLFTIPMTHLCTSGQDTSHLRFDLRALPSSGVTVLFWKMPDQ